MLTVAAPLAWLAASASLACSHAAPLPVAPPPSPAPPPRVLSVRDAAAADDDLVMYVDGTRFRDEVLRELIDAVGALRVDLQVELKSVESRCGFQPLLVVDELAVGVKWRGALPEGGVVARLARPLADAERCLRALSPGAQEMLFDGRRAWQLPGLFVTSSPGDLLVITTSAAEARAKVQRMLSAAPSSAPSPPGATPMVAGEVRANNPFGVASGSVLWDLSSSGNTLAVRARFKDEGAARSIERILKEGLLQALGSSVSMDPSVHDVGGALVQGTKVTRTGSDLAIDITAPSLRGQASVVGRITALAVRGEHRYVAAERMAEARDGVYKIARALAALVERQRALKQPMRFPSSAPLVPSDVPYGKTVTVTAEGFSHPSWRAIGYVVEGPVNYATDFVTASDGKSAVVRARGDIDRDGVTSLFELDVRIDRHGTVFIGPIIRERDPEE